ncbi:MAG: hypothetical protein CMJ19_07475 [Phycisphaeraceae bacterium]|nr:hypothetical protein [Phycisphaeraceae bacterium]
MPETSGQLAKWINAFLGHPVIDIPLFVLATMLIWMLVVMLMLTLLAIMACSQHDNFGIWGHMVDLVMGWLFVILASIPASGLIGVMWRFFYIRKKRRRCECLRSTTIAKA